MKFLECVPNFSEGRNTLVIRQIIDSIESISSVKVLHVDSGYAANRTVITFCGEASDVVESAFRAVKKAAELIDMSVHKGIHPRIGATDVLPLIPISGITMQETVEYARLLASRIGTELEIPVYCYENASFTDKRKNLSSIRAGGYEGLPEKMLREEWKPDFGPSTFNDKSGATVVGARNILVAYNVNLDSTDIQLAKAIAAELREKGKYEKSPDDSIFDKGRSREETFIPHPYRMKYVKAIGWFPEEYGKAQVSMNLSNINISPVHKAFENVRRAAGDRNIKVSGSELVGLIPLKSMLDAGNYILEKQNIRAKFSEAEIIKHAVDFLGLNDLYPFDPASRIIEYKLRELFDFNDNFVVQEDQIK